MEWTKAQESQGGGGLKPGGCDLIFLKAWPHNCPLKGRRKLGLTTWRLAQGRQGQTGESRSVLGAMKNNFLLKMGPRGSSLAQSRGVWATQEEFQGGVTENVRRKCQRQTAVSGWTCLLDTWLNCTMKEFIIQSGAWVKQQALSH